MPRKLRVEGKLPKKPSSYVGRGNLIEEEDEQGEPRTRFHVPDLPAPRKLSVGGNFKPAGYKD